MQDLGTLLVEHGAIDQNQLDSARSHQRSFGGKIEEILVERRMVSEPKLADAISQVTGTRRIVLDDIEPEGSARAKLQVSVAEEEVAFPVALRDDGRTLWVAVSDPTDIDLLDRLAARAGCKVRAVVAGAREIRRAISLHYRGAKDAQMAPAEQDDSDEGLKITDVSGNPVVTSLDQDKAQSEAKSSRRAPPPPVDDEDDDEDFAAGLFDIQALSPDEVLRLQKVIDHQEKGSLVLKAITELLVEKGVLSPDELRSRSD